MLKTKKKLVIIKKNRQHETDTGSAEVQVALLAEQIDQLAKHLKKHKKDEGSRRGLLKLVARRRTHLKYIDQKKKKLVVKAK
ncbi:MAG: 30S ribosomal protein S15 [Patescibacteria group bacterium]